MRQGTPTPPGEMPEQRGHVNGGGTVRRAGQAGGRATVSGVRAVRFQTVGGVPVEDVAVGGVFGVLRPGRAEQAGELPAAPRRRRKGTTAFVEQGHGGGGHALRGGRGPAARRTKSVRTAAPVRFGDFGCRDRSRRRSGRLQLDAGRVARLFAHVRQEGPTGETGVLLPEEARQESAPPALRPGNPAAQETQVQPAPVRRPRVLRRSPSETAGRGRQGVRAQYPRPQRVRLLSRYADRQTDRVPDPAQRQRKLFRNLRTEVFLSFQSHWRFFFFLSPSPN